MTTAVDLYAGAGGWDLAAVALDIDVTGIEIDDACAATREAVGFRTIHDDIRNIDPMPADGLIGSPTCQTFSAAGKGSGRKQLDLVLDIAHRLVCGEDWWTLTKDLHDERTALILEPLHWIFQMRKAGTPYRWIALEQVPTVRPVWEYYTDLLRWMGYSAVTANLQAETFGVPQTRKRAILIASLDRPAVMPTPTHSKYYPRDPQRVDDGVHKWVSMAEALGWGTNARPSMTVSAGGTDTGGAEPFGNGARKGLQREIDAGRWQMAAAGRTSPQTAGARIRSDDEPSATLTGKGTAVWMRQSAQARATVRHEDQPAPTITAAPDRAERVWLVNNTSEKAGVRSDDQPAPTMYFGARLNKAVWTGERPATTVNGDPRISKPGRHDPDVSGSQQADAIRVSVTEAAILQSFPPDFPWRGTKTRQYSQIGNAVPPLLAWHVLQAASGLEISDGYVDQQGPVDPGDR